MTKLIKSVCVIALCLFTIIATQTQCLGQDEPAGFKVFPIQHVDAAVIMEMVERLVQDDAPRMVMDHRLNRVYAQGHPNSLRLLEQMIAQVDVPAPPNETETQIKVFSLANAVAIDVANVLSNLIGKEQAKTMRLSVDDNLNSIIVSGEPQDLDLMEKLIARLDESNGGEKKADSSPENIVVRVTWLVDSSEIKVEHMREALRQPVAAHKELVKGLTDSGSMSETKSLTTSATSVQIETSGQRSNRFANSSMRNLNGVMHTMAAEGSVRQLSNDKYQLDISLDLIQGDVELSIGSTISLPKNHPVAFSVSDVGVFKSAAVVEILDAR